MAMKMSTLLAGTIAVLMISQVNAMYEKTQIKNDNAHSISQQKNFQQLCAVIAEKDVMEMYNANPSKKFFIGQTPPACEHVLAKSITFHKLSARDVFYDVKEALNHSQLREEKQSFFEQPFIDQVYQLDLLKHPKYKTESLTSLLDAMETLLLNHETQYTLATTHPTQYEKPDFKSEAKTLEDATKALTALWAKEALNDLPHLQPSSQEAKAIMAHLRLEASIPNDVKAYQATFEVPVVTRLHNIAAQLNRVQELHNKVSTPHTPYSTEYTRS